VSEFLNLPKSSYNSHYNEELQRVSLIPLISSCYLFSSLLLPFYTTRYTAELDILV